LSKDRLAEQFRRIDASGRAGLVLFLTAGFPDVRATTELVPALAGAGADCIELGVPFSDPLADGPTIQESSTLALKNGVTLDACIHMVEGLRERVPDTPLLLMGYYNPILSYGLEAFGRRAEAAGVDGVIVADLPPEEAGPLLERCRPRGIHVIPLLAPTSTDARIQLACRTASGFIYCVSLTGVTGAREELPRGVFDLLKRVRRHTRLPLAVGFGVSRRDHVESLGGRAQAAVVGSALIRVMLESPRDQLVERARRYVLELSGRVPSSGGGPAP
jgi:tryptophan synthase alpha chain